MNINQLEYFVSAARHLSFTKAAEECCVVQSAISQQIGALEAELGFALFNRSRRKIALTDAGTHFYRDTIVTLHQLKSNINSAQSIANGVSGRLSIGIAGYNQFVYMDALKHFQQKYPSIELSFVPVTTSRQYRGLTMGDFDIMLAATFNLVGHEDISFAGVTESRLCVFMHKDHPLAVIDDIDLELAAAYTNIFAEPDENSINAESMTDLYTSRGIAVKDMILAQDQNLNSFLLAFNMGIAIAPEELFAAMPPHILCKSLDRGQHTIRLAWAYVTGNANPALKSFVECLDKV